MKERRENYRRLNRKKKNKKKNKNKNKINKTNQEHIDKKSKLKSNQIKQITKIYNIRDLISDHIIFFVFLFNIPKRKKNNGIANCIPCY